jgi:hypothetical protein
MTGTTICVSTFIKQIVADNTALVRPFLAETGYFANTIIMAYCAIAEFFGLMPFVVEFHTMLEYKIIRSTWCGCR